MIYKSGKLNTLMLPLITFLVTINLISCASTGKFDTSLNNLYENLLQREYAGPISFPDHQVERKAQRSPSLRLRFGRSDPGILTTTFAEKRWLGDVNQKPIRSPSLRLRFGRRSDPSMSTNENAYLNEYNDITDDYPTLARFSKYDNKEKRKPSGRLRWGRSVFTDDDLPSTNRYHDLLKDLDQDEYNEFYEKLMEFASKLLQYDNDDNQLSSTEYEREIRKPGPLRLRWGRSTGGNQENEQQQQKSITATTTGDANQNLKQENKA